MTMLEHNLYTNWKVFLKINPTLTPKKTYVKFCCVGRNHTSLKNTCTTSTYFLQSKPLLVDPRECSLMNLTNLIITMMAHTDYSVNNFFSSSLPQLIVSQPFSLFLQPFLWLFLFVKHPNLFNPLRSAESTSRQCSEVNQNFLASFTIYTALFNGIICIQCVSYMWVWFYILYFVIFLFYAHHHHNDSFPNTWSKYVFGIIASFVLDSISNYDSAKLNDFHFGSVFVHNDLHSSSCIAL